jgi:hypothetical protein
MTFNDSSGKQGIVQDVWFRTNSEVNQFPLADITRYANDAYSRVANIIIQSDGRMQWDDVNHSNQPISATDLVANQQTYEIFVAAPTALQDWLMIDRIETQDANGDWSELRPIDKSNINISLDEYQNTPGQPHSYDFNGSELKLYPASDTSVTGGLKIYFNRAPSYFVSTDTTKRPGFATIFHDYISLYATHQWNIIKKNDYALQPLLDRKEIEIGKFYSKRNKVEIPRIIRAFNTFK